GPLGFGSHVASSPSDILRAAAAADRQVALDRRGDGGFGLGAVAGEAAVGPFDAAVAGRDIGLGEHDQAAFEPAHACDLLEPFARVGVECVVDAHDDVWCAHQLGEAV